MPVAAILLYLVDVYAILWGYPVQKNIYSSEKFMWFTHANKTLKMAAPMDLSVSYTENKEELIKTVENVIKCKSFNVSLYVHDLYLVL